MNPTPKILNKLKIMLLYIHIHDNIQYARVQLVSTYF